MSLFQEQLRNWPCKLSSVTTLSLTTYTSKLPNLSWGISIAYTVRVSTKLILKTRDVFCSLHNQLWTIIVNYRHAIFKLVKYCDHRIDNKYYKTSRYMVYTQWLVPGPVYCINYIEGSCWFQCYISARGHQKWKFC